LEEAVRLYRVEDYDAAIPALRRLAEEGNARAQILLGDAYGVGKGVEFNYETAFSWYQRAADQGHPRAYYKVALHYSLGWGVRQDIDEAIRWFRRAGEAGHYYAHLKLGLIYRRGETKDLVLPHMWFTVASRSGHPTADGAARAAARHMTEEEIAEAQALAAVCMRTRYRSCGR
jgi:TPR repeat protein